MLFGSKESKIQKCIEKQNAGPIFKMMNGKDSAIALQAIAALGKIAGDDSYNALIALLRDPSAQKRAAAIHALGDMGEPKAKAHISHLEKTEKDAVVLEAIRKTVGKLHTQD